MQAIAPQLPSPPSCWPSLHAFVSEGWQDLATLPPEGTCCNDFIEIVKRIALFIPLVFATLIATICRLIDCLSTDSSHSPALSITPPVRSTSVAQSASTKQQAYELLLNAEERNATPPLVPRTIIQTAAVAEAGLRIQPPSVIKSVATKEQEHLFLLGVANGDVNEVRRLLDAGIDMTAKDSEGRIGKTPTFSSYRWVTQGMTALHIACIQGHTEVAKELVMRAKSKDILNQKDHWCHSPLDVLCRGYTTSREGCLKVLLEAGASLEQRNITGDTVLHSLVDRFSDSDHTTPKALQMLTAHFLIPKRKEMEALLSPLLLPDLAPLVTSYDITCPEFVDVENGFGWTPLFAALLHVNWSSEQDVLMVDKTIIFLLKAGANPLLKAKPWHHVENPIEYLQRCYEDNPFVKPIIARLQEAAIQWQPAQ